MVFGKISFGAKFSMIKTIAISNYRSICNLIIPVKQLNVITGENGTGKSNLYRAMRIMSETAQGGLIRAIASEGGLHSIQWAGREDLFKNKQNIVAGMRVDKETFRLGFSTDEYSYAITLGHEYCTNKNCYNYSPDMPHKRIYSHKVPSCPDTRFSGDPQIVKESIWFGDTFRPSTLLINRMFDRIKFKNEQEEWRDFPKNIKLNKSLFDMLDYNPNTPEVGQLKNDISSWRFYDHFRLDADSPIRCVQLKTYSPILNHDGSNLAAAIETIFEDGDAEMFEKVISDAFPGGKIEAKCDEVSMEYEFLRRHLSAAELSDGTLRFILWATALFTTEPPKFMVINEPELSLHNDLIPPLARLIIHASKNIQIFVITHSKLLQRELEQDADCNSIRLIKRKGQTEIADQHIGNLPSWIWPDKTSHYS